jgi:N-acetylglucosamine kinase-like BadF-type ATPase
MQLTQIAAFSMGAEKHAIICGYGRSGQYLARFLSQEGVDYMALDLDPDDPGSPQRLKALVVADGFGPAGFARLAPVIDRLAAEGDPRAVAVMEGNAGALAAMAAGVARSLELVAPAVCPMGGALSHLERLKAPFAHSLALALPGSRLVGAAGDACQGALALAAGLLQGPAQA